MLLYTVSQNCLPITLHLLNPVSQVVVLKVGSHLVKLYTDNVVLTYAMKTYGGVAISYHPFGPRTSTHNGPSDSSVNLNVCKPSFTNTSNVVVYYHIE